MTERDGHHGLFSENLQGCTYQRDPEDLQPTLLEGIVEQIAGYPAQDFLSGAVHWRDLIDSDDIVAVESEIDKLKCQPGYVAAHEYRIRHVNGEVRWVSDIARVITIDGCDLIRGTIIDITHRKQAEEKLLESEGILKIISEQSLMGIFIIQDTSFIYMNEAFAEILAVPREDLLTSNLAERIAERVHPEDLPFVFEQMQKKQSGVQVGQVQQYSYRLTIGPEEIKWVDQYSKTISYNGRPAVLCTLLDVTQKEQAEQKMRELRNYLSNIINSMPSVLVGVDPTGTVTQWNTEATRETGISAADAVGQPLARAFPRLAEEMSQIQDAMRKREIHSQSRQARKEDGQTRYEDITVYPLIVNGVDGAVVRIDDVTERVRIEELMIQSEKMMSVGGLAAGMAHEINNPLAGMIQTASVLSDRLTEMELPANIKAAHEAGTTMEVLRKFMESRSIPQMLLRIRESGTRAAKIVSNMLSFARKGDAEFSKINLIELLDQCVDMAGSDFSLKRKFDFRQIEIEKEYALDLPEVLCAVDKIQQVLLNILRNGAEAMHEEAAQRNLSSYKPRIILRIVHDREAAVVRIDVEDNGPGMDEATRKRVFEPFFTTKSTASGTGLGLSVSYFIVTEIHGGELSVSSAPAQGATFTIRLPLEGRQS